jgi:hypothetical protein
MRYEAIIDLQKFRCLYVATININLVNSNHYEMVDVLGSEVVDNLKGILTTIIEDVVLNKPITLEDWNERFEDMMRLNEEFI